MGLFGFFKRKKEDINQYASIHGNHAKDSVSKDPTDITDADCYQLAVELHKEHNDQLLEGYKYSFSSMFDKDGKFDLNLAVSVLKRKVSDWKMVYQYNGISFKDFVLLGELGGLEMYNEALTAHNQELHTKIAKQMEQAGAQIQHLNDLQRSHSRFISALTDEQVRHSVVETSRRFAELEKKREEDEFEKWVTQLARDMHEKYPHIDVVTLYSRIVDFVHVLEMKASAMEKEFDYRRLNLNTRSRILNEWCSKSDDFRNQLRESLESGENKKL